MYQGIQNMSSGLILFFSLWMQSIRTLIPRPADILVNSYYLNPIFFVMTTFLEDMKIGTCRAIFALLLHQ